MLGQPQTENQRWLTWLESPEADATLGKENEHALFSFFTPEEFAVRVKRCKILLPECPARIPDKRQIPPAPVAPAAFLLPELLPAGAAEVVLRTARCSPTWIGIGSATVDRAGRVQKVLITNKPPYPACLRAFTALTKLSLANPLSIRTPLTTQNLVFVHGSRDICLDELPPSDGPWMRTYTVAEVRPPVVKRRVEPTFPDEPLKRLRQLAKSAVVVAEAVISRSGCVRSIRLVEQSPFPELNGAALLALSQWQFVPGRVDNEPVDVIFNFTVHFKAFKGR